MSCRDRFVLHVSHKKMRLTSGPTMGPWTIAQIGYRKLIVKANIEKHPKVKLIFKVILRPSAARCYAGIIVNIFKNTYAAYETNQTQKHFCCVLITLWHFSIGDSRRWKPHGGGIRWHVCKLKEIHTCLVSGIRSRCTE